MNGAVGCMQMAIHCLYKFRDLAVFMSRGLHPVPDEEVIAMYDGCHVPLENMSDFYGKVNNLLHTCCDPLQNDPMYLFSHAADTL